MVSEVEALMNPTAVRSLTPRRIGMLMLAAAMIMALIPLTPSPVRATDSSVVAFDMVGSASQNLTSYTNPWTGGFTSAADAFEKLQRGVSPTIPFSTLDDSAGSFPPDTLGIVKTGNTDEFFGVTDTVNGDTSGPVSATWVFDISGASGLALSIDMGAMGDFESSDTFVWEYQFDGGAVQTAFASAVDEAGSNTYTLESGTEVTLNDPMLMNGTILTNDMATFTAPLTGTGSALTLTLTASTDSGSEAFTFKNITIAGSAGPSVVAFDMVGSASQNLTSYTNPWTGGFTSAADAFEKLQRGVSPTIPFSTLDDSAGSFPPDTLGIVKTGNTDEFFGVTDTVNGDTSGPVSATWVFDISGASGLALSIDMGAMGDFESSDTFVWEYQFDGGAVQTAFASAVDEAGSNTYTLESGTEVTLNDPMLMNGTILTNDMATFTAPLTGTGSALTLTLTASTDSGSEAFTFKNITIVADSGGGGEPPSECGEAYTAIYEIQGNGMWSPLEGQPVVTEGVVVGDFQDGKSGYFIQDPIGDGDPATSDGVFVYGKTPDVTVGDHVRVTGTVKEHYDLTEVTNVNKTEVCDVGLAVTATDFSLPVASIDDFEPSEGMLVTFPDTLYISEFYNFARYGEVVVSTARQFQPTAVYDPGSPAAAYLATANVLSRVIIDDGRGSQNPDPALHPNGAIFDLNNLFRGGDTLRNVTGIVDYDFGNYKIQPTQGADYTPANPRTAGPADVGGNITVAAFNVLNYFITLGSRGADTPEEFTRQRDKIFAAMADIDADVLGLMEIENNGTAVADLVSGLNDVVGAGTYAYVDTGVIGPDAIAVAFIYKSAAVSLVGDFAVLDDVAFLDPMGYGEAKNRPALAQTFMDSETGGIFTAAVNHLKSKGSSCGVGDDDPEAGSCNLTRTMAAQVLADWLAGDPTGSGDEDFLIIGDLNSYDKEDPIDALLVAGYSDLIRDYPGENAYSYVFDGQLGHLDYAMANSGLANEVSGVTIWHINADEASLIDYDMSYKKPAQAAIYAPDAYRSSDHDPVIVGLDVCDEIAPTIEVTVSPDELWPANHKYVDVTATVVVVDNFDPNPVVTLVSVVSSEPDNGDDDGDTVDDIVIVDDYTFQLRAERSGEGEGRVYTITYEVTDACGNSTVGTATVFVPLSKAKK